MKPTIFFKKVHPSAKIPHFAHEGDSGMDVTSVEDVVIPPNERRLVDTGLRYTIPTGTEIQVRPRSGLALKNGLTVLNTPGTCDSNYRGNIKVILINHGDKEFKVTVGMRIAQLVFAEVLIPDAILESSSLDETVRGDSGFGSTGV